MATPKKTGSPNLDRPKSNSQAARSERRQATQAAQAAQRSEMGRRRLHNCGLVVALVAVAAVVIALVVRNGGDTLAAWGEAPVVGSDLHTVLAVDGSLYVGGHARAAVSGDDGKTWQDIGDLEGADAMGWAASGDTLLAGGHPGLYRSTDGGATFEQLTGSSAVPDVHALGGAGDVVYLASTQAGVMASTDGGTTWEVRNADAGKSFMGTILVDPQDPDRLIAPDMSGAQATSSDGGRTWSALGGPKGAMAAAWNPEDTAEIIAAGMQGAERSTDGGDTWTPVELPAGTAAVTYAPDGNAINAGVLSGSRQASTAAPTTAPPGPPSRELIYRADRSDRLPRGRLAGSGAGRRGRPELQRPTRDHAVATERHPPPA